MATVKTFLVAACCGLVLLGAVSAYASLNENGMSLNGMSLNGLSMNGLSINGLSINGLNFNGLSINGLNFNGFSFNGCLPQGISLACDQALWWASRSNTEQGLTLQPLASVALGRKFPLPYRSRGIARDMQRLFRGGMPLVMRIPGVPPPIT